MAEEGPENKSTGGLPSPSEKQSPRSVVGNGNGNNNDNNAGCVATSIVGGATIGSTIVTIVNESQTATSLGIIGSTSGSSSGAATPATPTSSASPLLTSGSSSTSGIANAIPGTSTVAATAPGGGSGSGVVSSTLVGGSGSSGNAAKSSGNSSPRSPKHSRKLRVKLSEQQLESSTREELAAKWREQDLYVECLEAQAAAQEGELACLRDSEDKYRQQCCEISHRERILVRRLASKEQQLLGYVNQITEMRASQTPTASALRSALLDPAVNILIQKLRQELQSTKAKLEDTQNELSAWKFTPDSNTGKRLMAKCRLLYQENEELGRMIASGRIAKLEGELVLQKSFSEEVKKSQSELDEFLQDLDEDVEGMQSTIYFLQQELRKARESVSLLQQENNAFKSVSTGPPPQPPPHPPPPQPPPPPIDSNNGLSNGVSSVSRATLIPKVEPIATDEEAEKLALVCPSKREIVEDGSVKIAARTPPSSPPVPSASPITETLSGASVEATGSLSDETKLERCRPDDQDESSNDSAALIIKVENEELSDREEDDEVSPKTAPTTTTTTTMMMMTTTTTTMTIGDACETRGPQRQSMRTRDKTMMKNESVIVGKSNGDERNSSRPASRRLLRDRTAKRDKSAADSDDDRRLHKKKRRESILSLDYNETDDDSLLLTNGESIQSDTEDGP